MDRGVNTYSGYHKSHGPYRCFVCGASSETGLDYGFVNAIAQCREAGKRILAMFRYDCLGPEDFHNAGVEIIISACMRHEKNAWVLCELTSDGVITPLRVESAIKAGLSKAEFHELVAIKAREIWDTKRNNRSYCDWRDAWNFFIKETGRIPCRAERGERARRLWEERKEEYSKHDWCEAEAEILKHHCLAVE